MRFFLILLASIILSSCANVSFVKRKYMPGYYVNKSLKIETADNEKYKEIFWDDGIAMIDVKNLEQQASRDAQIGVCRDETRSRLYIERLYIPQIIPAKLILKNKSSYRTNNYFEECDEVILMNGDTIKVKVTEIRVLEIKYRECNNLNGSEISILRADVLMIKFANGKKVIFNIEKSKNDISNKSYKRKATTNGCVVAGIVTLAIIVILLLLIFPLSFNNFSLGL